MLSLQETGNLSPDCLNHWTIREIPNKWLLTVWFFSEWDTGRRWKEVLAEMSATAGNIPVARASNNRVAVGGAKNSAGSGHLLAGSMQVRASHTTQVLTEHQSERVLGMCVCALGVHLGCVCVCVCAHVWLFATSWAVARQAPLSMGCPRQEYWSGLPLPPPGDLPNPGSKLYPLCLLHWQADSLPVVPPVKPHICNSQEKNTSE